MTGFIDRLQLRPQERRIVVAGAIVLFLLLNLWFVWPHFGSLSQHQSKRLANEKTLQQYQQETGRTNDYLARLTELEKEGSGILDADSANTVQRALTALGQANGMALPFNPVPLTARTRTNEYFEQITFSANLPPTLPNPLVTLLTSIASNNIVMRVRELDLKPSDASRTKLSGSLKVVASFPKKTVTRPSVAAATTNRAPIAARTTPAIPTPAAATANPKK